jgi:putative flippase GtrA
VNDGAATTRQFPRFVVIGVINTAFGLGVYTLLVLLGMPPQPALAVAFGIGVLWNFMLHGRFLFGIRGFGRLPHYIAAYIVTYSFNALSLQALLAAGLGSILAQTLLAPVAAVLSFILISKALTGHFPALGR